MMRGELSAAVGLDGIEAARYWLRHRAWLNGMEELCMTEEEYPMMVAGDAVMDEASLLTSVEGGETMEAEAVRYFIIHCSATRVTSSYTAEQLEADHKARGFRTGGYHFYVRQDGRMWQYRKLLEVGAHCRPWNRCSIGICYEGGLDADGEPANTLTQAQYERIMELLRQLGELFPEAVVRGHRDMPGATNKECPCLDAETTFRI